MTATSDTLGVDFGSSNTAAGALIDGAPTLLPLEAGADTIPTAVFFDFDSGDMLIGAAADTALLDGEEGRYMRALKLVLGAPIAREKRRIARRSFTFIDIVAEFLSVVKSRAETASGRRFTRALSGRPVHFHADPARDAQALADLAEAYRIAGFEAVDFLPEPEAAAIGYGAEALSPGALGLIVDIGGGTSDFTLFRAAPEAPRGLALLGSGGVRVGGADFDRQLSFDHVAPILGKDSPIRAEMGDAVHPAPAAVYHDLASWEKIPFLYTAQQRREVEKMRKLAQEPEKLARLERALELELGHELAFAVERAKIASNGGAPDAGAALGMLEKGLRAPLPPEALAASTGPWAARAAACAAETIAAAGETPAAVQEIFLVGGSSLMRPVQEAMADLCPGAQMRSRRAFTAVADGLALAAGG